MVSLWSRIDIFDLHSVSVFCTETYLLIQDNLGSMECRMFANSKQIIMLIFIGQLNIKLIYFSNYYFYHSSFYKLSNLSFTHRQHIKLKIKLNVNYLNIFLSYIRRISTLIRIPSSSECPDYGEVVLVDCTYQHQDTRRRWEKFHVYQYSPWSCSTSWSFIKLVHFYSSQVSYIHKAAWPKFLKRSGIIRRFVLSQCF